MKEILNNARNEIIELRRKNELLSSQMYVVEVFAAALGFKRNEYGMVPDIAWILQNKIEELSYQEKVAVDNDAVTITTNDQEQ